MKKPRVLVLAALVTVGALALGACSSSSKSTAGSSATTQRVTSETTAPAAKTIVEIAASNPDFSTLVAAVKAAGLAETLSGPGPYTVFAPTNEAFKKLPAGTLDTLLQPANKAKLAAILTYHVVAGDVMAKDVKPGPVKTVNGATFTVSVEGQRRHHHRWPRQQVQGRQDRHRRLEWRHPRHRYGAATAQLITGNSRHRS